MTADTRPVAQEAAEALREVVKPGGTVYATEHHSRSGDTCRVVLRAAEVGRDGIPRMARLNPHVRHILHLAYAPSSTDLLFSAPFALSDLLDRLSVALFGEPGQIKGEYL